MLQMSLCCSLVLCVVCSCGSQAGCRQARKQHVVLSTAQSEACSLLCVQAVNLVIQRMVAIVVRLDVPPLPHMELLQMARSLPLSLPPSTLHASRPWDMSHALSSLPCVSIHFLLLMPSMVILSQATLRKAFIEPHLLRVVMPFMRVACRRRNTEFGSNCLLPKLLCQSNSVPRLHVGLNCSGTCRDLYMCLSKQLLSFVFDAWYRCQPRACSCGSLRLSCRSLSTLECDWCVTGSQLGAPNGVPQDINS